MIAVAGALLAALRRVLRREQVPSTARHRKVTGPPASETQVLPRIPVDVPVGRHVGRAKVRDNADRWPTNGGSDLEVETRGLRYLMPNTVVWWRVPERLRRTNRSSR